MANNPIRIAILYFLNGFTGELLVTAIANITVPTIKTSGAKTKKSFFILGMTLGKSTRILLGNKNIKIKGLNKCC